MPVAREVSDEQVEGTYVVRHIVEAWRLWSGGGMFELWYFRAETIMVVAGGAVGSGEWCSRWTSEYMYVVTWAISFFQLAQQPVFYFSSFD